MDTSPDQGFPSSESFVDCAGVRRQFELEVRHLPNHGYAAEAREVTTSEHGGYVFKAFAEASGKADRTPHMRQDLRQHFCDEEAGVWHVSNAVEAAAPGSPRRRKVRP